MKLYAILPNMAEQAWPVAYPYIAKSCERSGIFDPDLIGADVLAGRKILWLASDGSQTVGAGVTDLFEQAGKKVCQVTVWGSRDQKRCTPLLATIEDFARAEGCTHSWVGGRPGWARHLKEYGYGLSAVIMEKAL